MTGPADLIVEGRIATLAGGHGFGWVEALAIANGRVVAVGSTADVEPKRGPRTRRLVLDPSEVAMPGLTDAHLHLAGASIAASQIDLTADPTIGLGLAHIGDADAALTDTNTWLLGAGWESDRWGGWPTASDLDRVAPGRPVALWAHDHHSLWVNGAALALAGIDAETPHPPGGQIRRGPDGRPTGVLHEAATRIVGKHIPPPTADAIAAAVPVLARDLLALGIVAVHDPGDLVPDPDLSGAFVAYARLADSGRLPLRVHASIRQEAVETATARGLRSGSRLGSGPDDRARVGWQKLFADGSLGSRTAALLEPFTFEPDRPLDAGRERGIFGTPPEALAELTARAAQAGIATQIHAIGDAAVRAALDALEPEARRLPLMPRVEHVQLVDPIDLPRFSRSGVAASVQPVHLRSDAALARHLWGDRAESNGYRWRSLSDSGALIPFGTDAPIEPPDPWPGLALAVERTDPSWSAKTAAFGPAEAITVARAIRAACLDGPLSAGESDRGRLVSGNRADLIVIPATAFDEPGEVDAALGATRPRLVLMDGEVVYEA